MTAPTTPAVTAPVHSLPESAGHASFAGTVRSEFTKIRSVRSTYWMLIAMVVVSVGVGALVSFAASRNPHGPQFDPTLHSLIGLYFGQLLMAAFGVLVISSEYSTGMIRTSLAVMPRRTTLIAAKAVVLAAVSLAVGLITSFASFFIGQVLMSGDHISTTLGHPGVLRAVIGGGLFLAACALLGFGLGLLIRHTAGAVCAAVGLLFVLSLVVNFLPQSWQNHVDKWVPAVAGTVIFSVVPNPPGSTPTFAPWTGFAVFLGYAAIAIAAGLYLFRKRNA
jgi:ABC-2 type transport system permease protein